MEVVFDRKEESVKPTYATLLLDESGSMGNIKGDAIGGYNEYISTLQKTGLPFLFTLLKWDSTHQTIVHRGIPIAEVPALTNETYKPGASTPLIDVCVKGIRATEKQVENKDVNVAITIQTDGMENASVEHTMDELNQLIKEKTEKGWLFTFLGVGIDAFAQAARMGIAREHALGYQVKKIGATFGSAARAVGRYGASGRAGAARYTADERASAGDTYDPDDSVVSTSTPTVAPAYPEKSAKAKAKPDPLVGNIEF